MPFPGPEKGRRKTPPDPAPRYQAMARALFEQKNGEFIGVLRPIGKGRWGILKYTDAKDDAALKKVARERRVFFLSWQIR